MVKSSAWVRAVPSKHKVVRSIHSRGNSLFFLALVRSHCFTSFSPSSNVWSHGRDTFLHGHTENTSNWYILLHGHACRQYLTDCFQVADMPHMYVCTGKPRICNLLRARVTCIAHVKLTIITQLAQNYIMG